MAAVIVTGQNVRHKFDLGVWRVRGIVSPYAVTWRNNRKLIWHGLRRPPP
jgi:hypothetical protein